MYIFIFLEIITAICALTAGVLCVLNPKLTIQIQQRFYEKINWRIQPINLEKELRNTRFMGAINILLAIVIILKLLSRYLF